MLNLSIIIIGKLFQPIAQVKLEKITINTAPNNPYFGEWSSKILDSGNAFSLKFIVKKDYPDETSDIMVIYLSIL